MSSLRHIGDLSCAEQAPECGSAYWRYGAALFYKAQDENDVFGDNLQDAAEQHDAQVRKRLRSLLTLQ